MTVTDCARTKNGFSVAVDWVSKLLHWSEFVFALNGRHLQEVHITSA